MMKTIVALFFSGSVLCLVLILTSLPFAERQEITRLPTLHEHYELLDRSTNAYLTWSDNRVIRSLGRIAGSRVAAATTEISEAIFLVSPDSTSARGAWIVTALIGSFGAFILISTNLSSMSAAVRIWLALSGAILLQGMLLVGWGRNIVVGSFWSMSILGAAVLSLAASRRPGCSTLETLLGGLYVGAAFLLLVTTLNHLAFAGALTALLVAWTVTPHWSRWGKVLAVGALAIALVTTALTPAPFSPQYPEGGHVVPDDGVPGMLRPLIGPMFIVPVVNVPALRELFSDSALLLLGLSTLAFILNRSRPAAVGLLLAACIWLHLAVHPEVSAVLPLATLERVIPGVIFYPSVPLLIPITLALALFSLTAPRRVIPQLAAVAIAWSAATVLLLREPSARLGIFERYESRAPILAFKELLNRDQITQSDVERARRVILSPSFSLIGDQGLWILEQEMLFRHPRMFRPPLRGIKMSASASASPSALDALFDQRAGSRWSPGGGSQRGGEWLCIEWQENSTHPIRYQGVELDTGGFFTDFPRGLYVATGTQCPVSSETLDTLPPNFTVKAWAPQWQGRVAFTDDGYPLYMPQSNVRLVFPDEVADRAVLIRQIGSHPAWDWSVAEFRLLRRREVPGAHRRAGDAP